MEERMEKIEIYGAIEEEDNMEDISLQYFLLVMVTIYFLNATKQINKYVYE